MGDELDWRAQCGVRLVDALNMEEGDKIMVGAAVYVLKHTKPMGVAWITMYFSEEDNRSETADLIMMMPIDRNLEVLNVQYEMGVCP